LDAVENNTYTNEKIEGWIKRLSTVYNRGFWEGYYLGRKLGEWTSEPGSIATEKKVYVGKGTKYYPKIKVGEFLVESGSIKPGDTLMISGANIGMKKEKLGTLIVNGVEGNIAIKGDKITFPLANKVTLQDKLYKIIEQ
jgi:putative protease